MKKKSSYASDYIFIAIGALLASFSVACILLPNDAIDYGTAGIAILINKLTGYNLSLCVIGVFVPFLVLGIVLLGKQFAFKALAGVTVYTIGLELFENVSFELNTEHFLAVAFGGAILGIGLSIILSFGGCIDGSEIFASIIVNAISKKTGRNFRMTYILLLFNICVYAAAFALLSQNSALLSLLVYVVATSTINNITDHFDAIKQVTIITQNADEIMAQFKSKLNKTCTVHDSRGTIAGDNQTVTCYISYFELQKVKEIVSGIDGTFMTISTIDEVIK